MRLFAVLLACLWCAPALAGDSPEDDPPAEEAPAEDAPPDDAPADDQPDAPAADAPAEPAPPPAPAPAEPAPPAAPVPPEPPAVDLSLPRRSCPQLTRCCVPGTEPCYHPGLARALLAAGAGAGFLTGYLGFEAGGDSLGTGDPYAQLVGTGIIGLAGAGIGTILGLLSPRGEVAVEDRPGRPTFRLKISPGGSSTLDEITPYGVSVSLDPTITIGDVFQIQPSIGGSFSLGDSADVDPRPQRQAFRQDQDSLFPITLTRGRIKVAAGAELAWKLPYPLPRIPKPAYAGAFELRYRPTVEVRRVTRHRSTTREQITEHVALYPAMLGFRWHLSPRQRFTFFASPRIDWIAFSDPGSSTLRRGPPVLGGFYAEAWYQVDVPLTPLATTKTSVSGRFNLGYVHSKLDGEAFDLGMIIGFFGPVNVSWDFRIRRRDSPVAIQIVAGIWLTEGGGPYLEIALVTPDIAAPAKGGPR